MVRINVGLGDDVIANLRFIEGGGRPFVAIDFEDKELNLVGLVLPGHGAAAAAWCRSLALDLEGAAKQIDEFLAANEPVATVNGSTTGGR